MPHSPLLPTSSVPASCTPGAQAPRLPCLTAAPGSSRRTSCPSPVCRGNSAGVSQTGRCPCAPFDRHLPICAFTQHTCTLQAQMHPHQGISQARSYLLKTPTGWADGHGSRQDPGGLPLEAGAPSVPGWHQEGPGRPWAVVDTNEAPLGQAGAPSCRRSPGSLAPASGAQQEGPPHKSHTCRPPGRSQLCQQPGTRQRAGRAGTRLSLRGPAEAAK